MPLSPLENALLQLFEELTSEALAIRALVSQDVAHSVLQNVKEKISRRHDLGGANEDAPLLGAVSSVIEAAVQDVDVQRLADEKQTTGDAVRRALNCVLDQTRGSQAHSSLTRVCANVPGDFVLVSHLGDVQWPASVLEHSSMLKAAHTTVFQRRETYGKHAVIVSNKDLETLLFGSTLLDLKLAEVYTNLVNKLPPEDRQSFEFGTWGSNGSQVAQQLHEVEKGKNASGTGRPRPPPIVTGGIPLMAKKDSNEAPHSKHSLVMSPGHSPTRKKTKVSGRGIPGPRPPKLPGTKAPKQPLNEYLIWSGVERARLRADDYSTNQTQQLANIWKAMTPDEKAPFIALRKTDHARYKGQGDLVKSGGSIDPLKERDYWQNFWAKARDIPRSKAALNADLYIPQSDKEDESEADNYQAQGKKEKVNNAVDYKALRSKSFKSKHIQRFAVTPPVGPMYRAGPMHPVGPTYSSGPMGASPAGAQLASAPPNLQNNRPASHPLRRMPDVRAKSKAAPASKPKVVIDLTLDDDALVHNVKLVAEKAGASDGTVEAKGSDKRPVEFGVDEHDAADKAADDGDDRMSGVVYQEIINNAQVEKRNGGKGTDKDARGDF